MTPQTLILDEHASAPALAFSATAGVTTHRLTQADKDEALRFLEARPLHTFIMAGFIRDHGFDSEFNRGTFFGCRDQAGVLLGVALIGHGVFVEARSNAALQDFASLARNFPRAHMIMGEQQLIERFWRCYSDRGQPARRLHRELLFELRRPLESFAIMPRLRLATIDELPLVVPIHAAGAFEESGVNPLEIDPDGFRKRCRRRIEQGRVWVWIERGELILKADVIADTPHVSYLEGLYVNALHRGKGYGASCLSQLSRQLLHRTRSVAVLIDEQNRGAQRLVERVGFAARSLYDVIFLERTELCDAAG